MRDTIKNYALTPAKKVYDNKEWWAMGTNNWCVVCNGGVAMAALAIGDEEDSSALCGEVLEKGMVSIRRALPLFAPDGAWFEGPGYWAYTVEYLAQYVASFDSALGSNYGIFDYPGISVTGYFPGDMSGATNRTVNLHDASEGTVNAPELG